jgi:6-phospho-beta-glucosidase
MVAMKLSVIGGGGVRSPLLARSMAARAARLGLEEVVLMDVDQRKLAVFGGLSQRVADAIAPGLRVRLTTDLEEAVEGAHYVITTIRAGGDEARALDERIALRLGVIGQETTGAGGFAMAMRSVPAMTACCRAVERRAAPGAVILNFTNPAGLVTQSMRDQGFERVFGICDAPSGMLRQLAGLLERSVEDLDAACIGLNHLSYFTSLVVDGRELLPGLLDDPRLYRQTDMRFFEPSLARRHGVLLNEYLYYYHYREKAVANMLAAPSSRGEQIREINDAMLAELEGVPAAAGLEAGLGVFETWYDRRHRSYMSAETGSSERREPFRFLLSEDEEGGYAGVALGFVEARARGVPVEMTLNTANGGAVEGLAPGDVVEASCVIDGGSVRIKQRGSLPPAAAELVRRVKAYERMASAAILGRDKAMAIDALFLHPLVGSSSLAEGLLAAFLDAHAGLVGVWT